MSDEDRDYDEENEELEEKEEREENEETEENAEVAPAAVEEDLPDEKPFTGEAVMRMPNGKDCTVRFQDKNLPEWLRFLVADDFFYFNRTIGGSNGTAAAGGGAAGDEENAEDGDDAAAAAAAEPVGEDGEDEEALNFDANTKFALELYDDEMFIYNAVPYIPPTTEDAADEPTATEGDADAADAAADAEKDDEEAPEDEEAEENPAGSTSNAEDASRSANAVVEETEVVLVDALTLAAVFSAEALDVCLAQPELNMKVFCDFCGETVTHKSAIIDNLIAAQQAAHAKTKKGAKNRRVKMDFAWIWKRQTLSEDPEMLPTTRSYVQRLVEADVVPSNGIPAALLTTAPAIRSYVYLLWQMPKTLLKAFSAPVPSEDGEIPEEDENGPKPVSSFLSQLLLDVRRRMARKKVGKRELRDTPESAQAAFFKNSGKMEDKKMDTICATGYAERAYAPKTLQLFTSDLALVMLGMAPAEFTKKSFTKLLEMKFVIKREHDNDSGLMHLMLHSLPEMTEVAAKQVIDAVSPTVFEPKKAVDPVQFAQLVIDEYFNYVDIFAKKFWVPFAANNAAMDVIQKKNPRLHTAIKECEKNYMVLVHSISQNKMTVSEFQKYETGMLSEATACTPAILNTAIEARNKVIIKYLVKEKHVTLVKEVANGDNDADVNTSGSPSASTTLGSSSVPLSSTAGKTIHVLQKVLQTNDIELVQFLVTEAGLLLTQTFEHGRFSAMTFIEDNWRNEETGGDSEELLKLLQQFRDLEHDRATDPDLKYGMLRPVPISA